MCEVHSGVHGAQGTSHSGASEEGSPSTLPAVLTLQSQLGH